MLRRTLDAVARSFKGDNYRLAPDVPTSYLVGLAMRRSVALLRGLLRLRAMVFEWATWCCMIACHAGG